MNEFAKKEKARLSDYKSKVLGIPEDEEGTFIWRGEKLKYGHILHAKREKKMNFLPSIQESLWDYVLKEDLELHTYFLHLNSSQAMCMNFFYPLFTITEALEEVILPFLPAELNGTMIDYGSVCFEKKGREWKWLSENKETIPSDILASLEKDFRSTSFDFFFRTTSGKKIFFEIKYTESGFSGVGGKKSDKKDDEKYDKKYRDKFEYVYKWHLLHIKDEYSNQDGFLKHYQIMRNLAHVDKDSFVVFIYPSQNKGIVKGINIAGKALKNYTDHFIPIEWEHLADWVESRLGGKFIKEFKDKYFGH